MNINIMPLHLIRHLNTQQSHGFSDSIGSKGRKLQSHSQQVLIFGFQDRHIMIKLIVFFNQLINIISYQCRAVSLSSLIYNTREVKEPFYQILFALVKGKRSLKTHIHALISSFTQHRLDTGMRVLYKWPCIAI